MSVPEKPFACRSDGCKMSFTNEDHLMVHTKKHDMNLNLGIGCKSNIFVADQTPTPTRFIRNCEEVGLFQDLQNVNPFEETFRRATELVKSGNLPTPDILVTSDDTLHTPHVFPVISEDYTSTKSTVLTKLSTNHDYEQLKTPVVLRPEKASFLTQNEPLSLKFDDHKVEYSIKTPVILKNNTLRDILESKFNNTQLKHDLELQKIQNSENNDDIEVINANADIQIKKALNVAKPVDIVLKTSDNTFQKTQRKENATTDTVISKIATKKKNVKTPVLKPSAEDLAKSFPSESTKQRIKAAILNNKLQSEKNLSAIATKAIPQCHVITAPNILNLQTGIPQAVSLRHVVQNPIILDHAFIKNGPIQTISVVTGQQILPKYTVSNIETQIVADKPLKRNVDSNKISRPRNSSKPENKPENEEDLKKETLLMRNRAAAIRARNKRKLWIDSLVKQNENLLKSNHNLNTEVGSLRNEVLQLKSLLLAHNDCSVTKALRNSNEELPEFIQFDLAHSIFTTAPLLKRPAGTVIVDNPKVPIKKLKPNVKPLSIPTITFTNFPDNPATQNRNVITKLDMNGSNTVRLAPAKKSPTINVHVDVNHTMASACNKQVKVKRNNCPVITPNPSVPNNVT